VCEDAICTPEHQDGLMRNNLIVNCSDVGIYLNEARACEVHHNTLYANLGIDVRFAESTVTLANNLVSGWIRERDGGTATLVSNLTDVGDAAFASWFAGPAAYDFRLIGDGSSFIDQGSAVAGVADDFCQAPRDAAPDIGAVEYGLPPECATASELDLYAPLPDALPALVGPGNTLMATKLAASLVALAWRARTDSYWNLYRDAAKTAAGTTLLARALAAPGYFDDAAGPRFSLYQARASDPCALSEAP
jgi:parallel beta-helix repeat protein